MSGTPNLLGFAYFLTKHKEVLGRVFIDKEQVFQSDTAARSPSIVEVVKMGELQGKLWMFELECSCLRNRKLVTSMNNSLQPSFCLPDHHLHALS